MARDWRLPAEWEPQRGTMLVWPHGETDWSDDLPGAERAFLSLASAIARRQTLLSVCSSEQHRDSVEKLLRGSGVPVGNLIFAVAASNDSWARDFGPMAILDPTGIPQLVDFRFNGWGRKFPADKDDRISRCLHANGVFGDTPLRHSEIILEGGAIESDGAGTLLAIERTIVDPRRNPGRSRSDLEQEILSLTGADRFQWLRQGYLSGDDTDGHIDTLARFVDCDTLVYVTTEPDDADYPVLQRLEKALRSLRRRDGTHYNMVTLPSPGEIRASDGRRLPASYANYQLINDAILVPCYDSPRDRYAADILAELHPGRDVVGIDATRIIQQNGSLHCLCMQFPLPLALHDPMT